MRTQLSACTLAFSLLLGSAMPLSAQTSGAPASGPATSPAMSGTTSTLGTPATTTGSTAPSAAPGWNDSEGVNLRPAIGGAMTTPAVPGAATTNQTTGLNATNPLSAGSVPGGALSAGTMGAPNTTGILEMNAQAPPPPLMGTITQEVALSISKQPVQRGGYTGLVIHLHNGTNSPLMFDGDRAFMKKGGQCVNTVTAPSLEETTCPGNNFGEQAKIAVEDAITVGLVSTIHDQTVNRGPVLNRYGCDQKRRVAANERFGRRILWPGDDTEGIMFFNTHDSLSGGELQLPVVTFPTMEIRGYLSSTY